MNIKDGIELGLEVLERDYGFKYTRRSKEELILAFSQKDIPAWKFLGYSSSSGVSKIFLYNDKIKEIKKPNISLKTFILNLINKFHCFDCNLVLDIKEKVKAKTELCKRCDTRKSIMDREEKRKYIYNYLLKLGCVDCNESDPIVLEFDHINPNNKKYNISNMMNKSIKDIDLEIAKCEVVCANCHRRRTAKQQGWYKFLN